MDISGNIFLTLNNPSGATNMKFKYNGKVWNPKNPEKKLKQLRITWDDVEIINEEPEEKVKEEINESVKLYKFKNKITNEIITSIYPTLDHLVNHVNDWY